MRMKPRVPTTYAGPSQAGHLAGYSLANAKVEIVRPVTPPTKSTATTQGVVARKWKGSPTRLSTTGPNAPVNVHTKPTIAYIIVCSVIVRVAIPGLGIFIIGAKPHRPPNYAST